MSRVSNLEQTPVLPKSNPLPTRLKHALASIALVALFCAIYALAPHNQQTITRTFRWASYSFTGGRFLLVVALVYSCLLTAYELIDPSPGLPKSMRFFQVIGKLLTSPAAMLRQGLDPDDRLAILTTFLKGFFGPLMVMSLMAFCMEALSHAEAIAAEGAGMDYLALFNRHGFWILLRAIFFIDVLLFTIGYLIESPRLGNEIRSVDPTLLGWGAALLCYPPFNMVTVAILGSQVSDFPQFDNPTVHVFANTALLILMTIYASASVALGLKASNLTHRGIVAHGPYAFMRHPAYIAKCTAWWIGATPMISSAFGQGFAEGMTSFGSMLGWTALYVLRALTEEDHLRGVDDQYAAYAARVRYRFIPGLV